MHNYILQDWITIRGSSASPGQIINQGESTYLDMAPYQDISFWLDCREVTGSTPTIAFQTAPLKEDTLFLSCVPAFALSTTYGNPSRVLITQNPNVPLARWVRWQLQGPTSAAWDCTFRVLVTANALGL